MARLTSEDRRLLHDARRGVLATIAEDGRPRLYPIAFAVALADPVVYSALDEKPKSVVNPRDLARVRDIVARPRVAFLVDRWSEDWTQLAWLRLEGTASLLEPPHAAEAHATEHDDAIRLLRERYPQYAPMALERAPLIRISVERVVRWTAASPVTSPVAS